jgi:DNA-3-methyladenine glycosylase II
MFLAGVDDDWARHVARVGPCMHKAKPAREPFEALVRAVAYQQLHAKAGDAILRRFLALYPHADFPKPREMLETEMGRQRACGFSATKLNTIRTIAQAAIDGVVPDRETADKLSDESLISALTSLKGIGRWTVEMFLIYTLERPDILPVDDFGVREGYRRIKGLLVAPKAREMRDIGLAWSPHRTAAAWYLWRATE